MLKQGLNLKLLQKLSPQQIQLMKLLQIPTVALEQRIKEELQENPALEEGEDLEVANGDEDEDFQQEDDVDDSTAEEVDDYAEIEAAYEQNVADVIEMDDYVQDDDVPYYKLTSNNGTDEEKTEIPIAVTSSFTDTLYEQLATCQLSEKEEAIAEYVIGNIDDDGYLRRPIQSIVDDMAFSQTLTCTEEEVIAVLKMIQKLEPAGIGARDLRECLLLQLYRQHTEQISVKRAIIILKDHMEEFYRKHYDKIMHQVGISEADFKMALQEILKLNPRPGDSLQDSQKSLAHITPDFIITNNDGNLEMVLNTKNAPDLRVSRSYVDMLGRYAKNKKTKNDKEAVHFVKQKIDAAKWFIEALNQRQQTLYTTMSAILERQSEYFLEGDETKLKPMILKDIADEVGLDISTISRVANSKYAQTPFGTISLKSLFSEAMHTEDGEEVSSREIKRILSDTLAAEDKRHPITDDALADLLKEKGYTIARRTVAKYREQLNIPVARMRKEL